MPSDGRTAAVRAAPSRRSSRQARGALLDNTKIPCRGALYTLRAASRRSACRISICVKLGRTDSIDVRANVLQKLSLQSALLENAIRDWWRVHLSCVSL